MNKQEIKELIIYAWHRLKMWWYVPPRCRGCEIMGYCRGDPKNNYRCGRRGCLLLWEKERDERERKRKEKQTPGQSPVLRKKRAWMCAEELPASG